MHPAFFHARYKQSFEAIKKLSDKTDSLYSIYHSTFLAPTGWVSYLFRYFRNLSTIRFLT